MDNVKKYFPSPVTASPESLMEQAPETVARFLRNAVEKIDKEFGEGFSKENPALVGVFIHACLVDLNQASGAQNIQAVASALIDSLDGFLDLACSVDRRRS